MSRKRRLSRWRVGIGTFIARPKLLLSIAVGVTVALGSAEFLPNLPPSTHWLAGWNSFCATFVALILITLGDKGPSGLRAGAEREDEGAAVILLVILAACVASIVGVAIELDLAKNAQHGAKALHVIASFVTVTASWFLVQFVYALHYAHSYYAADDTSGRHHGGLGFPDEGDPDLWDFIHFAIIIGVASQTADVTFTSKRLRRIGTWHSLIAYAFNVVIVGLTMNLVGGLF